MTPDYIAVEQSWSIQQTLTHIREHGRDSETLTMVYVVDGQGHLIDDIHIRSLLLAPPTHTVSHLMDKQVVRGSDPLASTNTFKAFRMVTVLSIVHDSGSRHG